MNPLPLRPDLSRRVLVGEVMDDAELDPGLHIEALIGLARLNRLSRSVPTLWATILGLTRRIRNHPLRILDVATGAGDVPIRLWQLGKRKSVPMEIEACDRSRNAIEHARQRADKLGACVRFFQCDAVEEDFESYDVVICSLFLHHLSDDAASRLLRKMSASARRLMLVSDLERCTIGLALAYGSSRLLTKSRVVKIDAVRSARAAFTRDEVKALARQAGLVRFRVFQCWPWRFILKWRRA